MKSRTSTLTTFSFPDWNKKSPCRLNTLRKVWSVRIWSNSISVIMLLIHLAPKHFYTFWSKRLALKFSWFIIVVWEHLELKKLPKDSRVHQILKLSQLEETECKMPVFKQSLKALNSFHCLNNSSFIKTLLENKVFIHCLFNCLSTVRTWPHLTWATTSSEIKQLWRWQTWLKTVWTWKTLTYLIASIKGKMKLL